MTATMAPTTTQTSEPIHTVMPVALIDISETNPRKHFDKEKLQELGESILHHGVLVPLLVRPITGDRYELIAGERRLRAARDVAWLTEVPVIVRQLSDKEALEVQVVENLQRADLHPLEEAEGYATLIRDHGYDADSLAEKIGKSRSYVYGRIKLGQLCDEVKQAVYDEKINHSVALLIARIPDAELQLKALSKILPDENHYSGRLSDEALSYRQAKEILTEDFTLPLKGAKFDRNDATLVPENGPCTTCQFRSGNQKELFADIDSPDVCTLPPCFRQKEETTWQRSRAKDAAKGAKILTLDQGAKLAPWGHVQGAKYVDVKNSAPGLSGPIEDFLPKDAKVSILRDGYGKMHTVIAKKDLASEIERAGHKVKEPKAAPTREERQDDWKLRDKIEEAITSAVGERVEAMKQLTPEFEEAILRGAMLDADFGAFDSLRRRRGDLRASDEKVAQSLTRLQMFAILAEIVYGPEAWNGGHGADRRKKFLAEIGVDPKAIEKRIRDAEKKPAEPKAAKKAKARK